MFFDFLYWFSRLESAIIERYLTSCCSFWSYPVHIPKPHQGTSDFNHVRHIFISNLLELLCCQVLRSAEMKTVEEAVSPIYLFFFK